MLKLTLSLIFLTLFAISYGLKVVAKKNGSKMEYSELIKFLNQEPDKIDLDYKVNELLNRVVIQNKNPAKKDQKENIRIAQWNIERGYELDAIKSIFQSPDKFINNYIKNGLDSKAISNIKKELELLSQSDILLLNEVDWGIDRTKYKNVVEEIADVMEANYAFATEFLELSPLQNKVNKNKYLGLHGNAIVSKFPIKSAKLIRLPNFYDWYGLEKELMDLGAPEINQIPRELRLGSRVAILAELELVEGESFYAVSVHLEDRTGADQRKQQFESLFKELRNIDAPVILGGDLNTLSFDATPAPIKKFLNPDLNDSDLFAALPISFESADKQSIQKILQNHLMNTMDVDSISSYIASDQTFLKKFEDEVVSLRFLDSSNFYTQVSQKLVEEYACTFKKQDALGVGNYKLDWLLVKPSFENGHKKFMPLRFDTLNLLNYSYKDHRISDHSPIVVDVNL